MTAATQEVYTLDQLKDMCAYFEWRYGLPDGLLYSIMGRATHWGQVAPPDGTAGLYAQNLASFVPFVESTFKFPYDPADPVAATQALALYLSWAYHRFGAWDMALAAYAWGWQAVAGYLRAKLMHLNAQLPLAIIAYIKAVAPQYLRK